MRHRPHVSAKAPRFASAVVLHRIHQGRPQVFLVRRSDRVRFMGGFHAFPGGAADKQDATIAVEHVPDGEPADAVVAAIRETFEETGVLFAAGGLPEDTSALELWRERVLSKPGTPGAATFAELIDGTRLSLDARGFRPIGHWITPPFAPIRFDTRFYLAAVPGGQEPAVWPGELADGGWIEPAAAVEQWERGEALMAPPILHILRACASSPDPARWPEAATGISEARGGEVRRIEMRRGVLLVPLRTPTLPPATHTNCYVVGGNRPVVIDPGAEDAGEQKALDDLLAALAREGRRPSGIAITHHHHDHVGGVDALRARLKIPVIAHADTRDALAGRVAVDQVVEEGHAFDTGDGAAPLRALHTPGHAHGHLAFLEEGTRSLLSGDLILGMGTTVVDPPDGDMESYMRSLERLAGMELASLFPGHGPVLARAQDQIAMYRKHRAEREEQVLAAMAAGARTPEQIVSAVYTEVPVGLHPFAARSVLAHLEWMERRGDVRRAGAGWERTSG